MLTLSGEQSLYAPLRGKTIEGVDTELISVAFAVSLHTYTEPASARKRLSFENVGQRRYR